MSLHRAGTSLLAGAMLAMYSATDASRASSPAAVSPLQGADPAITVLHQNFPNPFPAPGTNFTCIWFDLHRASQVHVTILDIRGTVVRTVVPSAYLSTSFPAGRFGRGDPVNNVGCDSRFIWDGNDDSGRTVPPGVYLLRLRTEYFNGVKRIVFRGR